MINDLWYKNAIFYCLQGQIAIFLITVFSHRVGAVAEVGALGRLAMIYSVIVKIGVDILVALGVFAVGCIFVMLLHLLNWCKVFIKRFSYIVTAMNN